MDMKIPALFCLLLLACTLPAGAVPALPEEIYGTVSCGGTPAPAGTVVTALIDGTVCGKIVLENEGVMGGTGTFEKRLVISGGAAGETIVFMVNGYTADETLAFSPGTVVSLDLTAPASALSQNGTHAAFVASPTVGVAPVTVGFTDLSTNATTWAWTFGDGTTSAKQHPSHTYTRPGNYTVELSINGGEDTCTRSDFITVTPLLFGDANNDTTVNQADTLRVLKEVVGLTPRPTDPDVFNQTDVHKNGVIEVGDALFIAQYNVGLRGPWFERIGP